MGTVLPNLHMYLNTLPVVSRQFVLGNQNLRLQQLEKILVIAPSRHKFIQEITDDNKTNEQCEFSLA